MDDFAPKYWSYADANDMFSTDTAMPSDFPLYMSEDWFDFSFDNPKTESSTLGAFAIFSNPAEDTVSFASISSDLESDDQSWSPTVANIPFAPTTEEATCQPLETTKRQRRLSLSAPALPTQPPTTPSPVFNAAQTSPRVSPRSAASIRKSRNPSTSSDSSVSTQAPGARNAAKRAAHNIIEKRYRTNMNAKFMALEKAISASPNADAPSSPHDGSTAALKKSEILSNAITYIRELQDENKALRKTMDLLRQNLLSDARPK